MALLGPVIGAAGNLIGGLLGQSSANKAAEDALNWQKYYARNRVRLTVRDAETAGIHPLAALGSAAAGSMVSPPMHPAPTAMGDAVGRAADIIATQMETERATQRKLDSETERNIAEAGMINEATSRSQIENIKQTERTYQIGSAGKPVTFRGASQEQLEAEIGEIAELYGVGQAINAVARDYGAAFNYDVKRIRNFVNSLRRRADIQKAPTRAIDARNYLERR